MELCVWVSEINIEKIKLEELVNKKKYNDNNSEACLSFFALQHFLRNNYTFGIPEVIVLHYNELVHKFL